MTSRRRHYLGEMSRIEHGLGIRGLTKANPDGSPSHDLQDVIKVKIQEDHLEEYTFGLCRTTRALKCVSCQAFKTRHQELTDV